MKVSLVDAVKSSGELWLKSSGAEHRVKVSDRGESVGKRERGTVATKGYRGRTPEIVGGVTRAGNALKVAVAMALDGS